MSTKITIGQKIKYVLWDRGRALDLIPPLLTRVLASIGTSFITPEDDETTSDNSDNNVNFSNFDPNKKYIGRHVRREVCGQDESVEEQTPPKKQKKLLTGGLALRFLPNNCFAPAIEPTSPNKISAMLSITPRGPPTVLLSQQLYMFI